MQVKDLTSNINKSIKELQREPFAVRASLSKQEEDNKNPYTNQ